MRRDRYSSLARQMQAYQGRAGVASVVVTGGDVAIGEDSATTGVYYGKDWGIYGGLEDESTRLQLMLNEVGAAGGGHVVIRARNPADKIPLRKLASIYYNNIHLEFRSPQILGKVGGVRIMGSMVEFVRNTSNGGKLDVNAVEGSRVITLATSPTSMQAVDFLVGDYIVLRGLNRFDGNAIQKQYLFVTAIDTVANTITVHEELEYTFQPTYGSGDPGEGPITETEYDPDRTTGSVIKVIKSCQILVNVTRGMYEFEVSTASNVNVGDIIRLADTRVEIDMNPSALRSNGLPYENECNMEFARVIKKTATTGDNAIITLDHAVCKNYLTGAPYYGSISVADMVSNSRISGIDATYDEIQDSKNYHAVTIAFGFNCHAFDGHINGYYGRRGQGYRISDSYLCSGSRLLVEGGLANGPNPLAPGSGSGENYGLTGYKCTGCWYTDCIAKDCRHSFLLQATTLFTIRDCESWGDKISGFDLHGALEFDTVLENCRAIRTNQHTDDANNGAGFRGGNTSHTPGSHHTRFVNCTATGYKETNCAGFDILPDCTNVEMIACTVFDCFYGFTFTRNSKQVTPVQDVNNWRLLACTVYDATDRAYRIIGAPTYDNTNSNGKITSLSFKECVTVRCDRHWVIDGNAGVTNLLMEGCDVIEPVALAGEHVYDISDVLGYVTIRNCGAVGGNKGLKVTNCPNYLAVTNLLSPTIESVPFTDGGGNTGGVYIDVFSGGGAGSYVPLTLIDDKGDIFVGTSPDTASIVKTLGVADGYVMTVNAASAAGVTWAPLPAPSYLSAYASSIPLAPMWKGAHIQGAGTDGVRFWAGYTGYNIYWNGTAWQIGTDGGSNGATLVMAAGTGDTLQTYSIPSTGTIPKTVTPANLINYLVEPQAGNSSFTTDVISTATTPRFELWETDAALNEKRVRIQLSAGMFQIRFVSDDGLTAANAFTITRSGINGLVAAAYVNDFQVSSQFTAGGNGYFGGTLQVVGTSLFQDRMTMRTGPNGSAGTWYADAGGNNRMFHGLVEDDATPVYGFWSGSLWRMAINHLGQVAFLANSGVAPSVGFSVRTLTVWGGMWLYENAADWIPIQMRGRDGQHYSRVEAVGDSNIVHSAIVFEQVLPTGAGAPNASRIWFQTMLYGGMNNTMILRGYGVGINVDPGTTATLYVNAVDLGAEAVRILGTTPGTAPDNTLTMLKMMYNGDWDLRWRQKHIGGSRITYENIMRQNGTDFTAFMIDPFYGAGGIGIWNDNPRSSLHLKMLGDVQSGMAVQLTSASAGGGNVTVLPSGTVGYSFNNPVVGIHGVARHSVNGASNLNGACQSGTNYVHTNAGGSTLTFSVTSGGEVRVSAAGVGSWSILAVYTYT